MANRLCVLPIGDMSPMHDFLTAVTIDGEKIPIKNKYFECEIKVDDNYKNKPHAIIWVGFARFTDMMPPNSKMFEDCELRLLLRVLEDNDKEEIPENLANWETDSLSEVINVKLSTLDDEVQQFRDGKAHSSLLDEVQQPAGSRILEALEMVDWPIKMISGKPRMQQRIDQMVQLLKGPDPECENFEQAMSIMMELKEQIPKLPEAEKHKYAAAVALAFGDLLGVLNEEEEEEEEKDEKGEQSNDNNKAQENSTENTEKKDNEKDETPKEEEKKEEETKPTEENKE